MRWPLRSAGRGLRRFAVYGSDWRSRPSRLPVAVGAALLLAGYPVPAPAGADEGGCNDVSCIPGIDRVADLGSYCDNTIYYVFATTGGGRVIFCDSAKGLAPRYFRSLPVAGIRDYNASCDQPYNQMAQAPDGLFLLCGMHHNADGTEDSRWIRGDAWDN